VTGNIRPLYRIALESLCRVDRSGIQHAYRAIDATCTLYGARRSVIKSS